MTTPAPALQFVFALYLRSWLNIALMSVYWHKADSETVHDRREDGLVLSGEQRLGYLS